MIRHPPFGQPLGTPWVNGNPATGERGSVTNAMAIDHAQEEIVNAIIGLGLIPDAGDRTQLRKAIQNAIAAATGGGDPTLYATVAMLRASLPHYPEVETPDGKLSALSPSAGTIFLIGTGSIKHRGLLTFQISEIAELDRTFATLPSKTYHLRWRPSTGFGLFDIADAAYNPTGLAETATAFDSGFDDMLAFRIVTDANNVATIVALENRDRLWFDYFAQQTTGWSIVTGINSWALQFANVPIPLNWARTPRFKALNAVVGAGIAPSNGVLGVANAATVNSLNRYGMNFTALTDFGGSNLNNGLLTVNAAFGA